MSEQEGRAVTQTVDPVMQGIAIVAYVVGIAMVQPWTYSSQAQGAFLLIGAISAAIGAQLVLLAERDVL